MILDGYVRNNDNAPISKATVEIKGADFGTLYSAESDENGYYKFDIPAGYYPFLVAIKDYAVDYLEYWCQNIRLRENTSLDVSFDKLEIYGLHVFSVKGAGNGLMVYFRPMSLIKFQNGEQDIAPNDIAIKIMLDGKECPVVIANSVKEFASEREMSAYLVQIETSGSDMTWNKLDIQIRDNESNYGAATIFNENV